MPFRIPQGYRALGLKPHDPDCVDGGGIADYLAWLEKEVVLCRAFIAQKAKEAKVAKSQPPEKPE